MLIFLMLRVIQETLVGQMGVLDVITYQAFVIKVRGIHTTTARKKRLSG